VSDVTCYTILSRDAELLDWCVSNARERAGIDHEWLLVHWVNKDDSKEQIRTVLETARKTLGMRYVCWLATPETAHEFGDDTTPPAQRRLRWFLYNLYACWNLGYKATETPWVARLGSDQFFSQEWLARLMDEAALHGERAIYHCHTVESTVARHSRHPIEDFGSTWQEFNARRFDAYADEHMVRWAHMPAVRGTECGLYYNHPARGQQERPDGCTWLQTRALWEEFGPMEDSLNAEGVTGDVAYMDRMYDAGVPGWLVNSSLTYHLVRGESRETQV